MSKIKVRIFFLVAVFFSFFALAGSAQAERFFRQNSSWYEKIPANPAITPHSNDFVNEILADAPYLYPARGMEYGYPVYYASSETPLTTVEIWHADKEYMVAQGWNQVPIPSGALPAGNAASCYPRCKVTRNISCNEDSDCPANEKCDNYRDGNMTVISYDRQYIWDFYRASYCNGHWQAYIVRKWDASGTGVNCPYDGHGNPSSSDASLRHLIYTYDELANDSIDHAVGFIGYALGTGSYAQIHYPYGIYPVCGTGNAGINTNQYSIPTGMRFQLDPAVNCDSLSLTIFGKRICKALQDYGMIAVEGSGHWNEYIMLDAAANWESEIGNMEAIPLDRFRVVEPVCSDCSVCSNCVSADTTPPASPGGLSVQ